MWKFSTTLQRRWSGSHGSLRSTTQIPLQGSTSSSFAGSTVSRPPIAVCCLWELPQLQGTAQLRSHPLVVLPISNDQPVQDDEVVLLPTSGQLWRSFWSQSSQVVGQGCCWILITTVFPSIHSCCFPSFLQILVSTSTLLINHPAGYASSQSLHLREPRLRCPISQFCLPTKAFLHRVSNEHRFRKHFDAGKYECEN